MIQTNYLNADTLSGLQPGIGVDSLMATNKKSAAVVVPPTMDNQGGDAHTRFSLSILDATQMSADSSAFDARVALGFGIYSGSAQTSVLQSAVSTQRSVRVLARVTVSGVSEQYSTTQILAMQLTPAASSLLTTTAGVNSFRRQYGDSFVSGVVIGGEFVFSLDFTTASTAQATAIRADVQASGGFLQAADFQASITRWTQSNQVQVSVNYDVRGTSKQPASTSIADILSYASQFASFVLDPANTDNQLQYLLSPYESVPGWPAGVSLDDSPAVVSAVEGLAEYFLAYSGVLADLRFINNHNYAYDFTPATAAQLEKNLTEVSRLLDVTLAAANQDCAFPAPSPLLTTQNADSGKPLVPAEKLEAFVPAALDYWFTTSPNSNTSLVTNSPEIDYYSGGTWWVARIVNGAIRNSNPKTGVPNPPVSYIVYDYGPDYEHVAYKVRATLVNGQFVHTDPDGRVISTGPEINYIDTATGMSWWGQLQSGFPK